MFVTSVSVIGQLTCLVALSAVDSKSVVVVRVNGKAVTVADVEYLAIEQNVPDDKRAAAEPKLIEILIDRQIIRSFLAAKKIEPPADELQQRVTRAEEIIRSNGEEPEAYLKKVGFTSAKLKTELGLPLAWQAYARRTITSEQFKQFFEEHRQELDGTQLRGGQIFWGLTKDLSSDIVLQKKENLARLRSDIISGKISFTEAAKKFSEAPSAEKGGDLGLFGWRDLPPSVSKAAFALKLNEVSEPIHSPFGLHLVLVSERHPGEFSLEDVREIIAEELARQLWVSTVKKERISAKIVHEKKSLSGISR